MASISNRTFFVMLLVPTPTHKPNRTCNTLQESLFIYAPLYPSLKLLIVFEKEKTTYTSPSMQVSLEPCTARVSTIYVFVQRLNKLRDFGSPGPNCSPKPKGTRVDGCCCNGRGSSTPSVIGELPFCTGLTLHTR